MIVAGIMSGTSLDGIDVALLELTGSGWKQKVKTLGFHSVPYPLDVREALLGVSNRETHTAAISRLNFLLPELYAEAFFAACKRAKVGRDKVELIGCHGQTVFHESEAAEVCGRKIASTLQVGDGSVLAERTGVPVVSDFRPRDMAAGGQGAPLVPFVDYLLFRDEKLSRVALNIGGIANITHIPAGAPPEKVVAFDTGPGNMVIDQLISKYTDGAMPWDRNGEMASAGLVHPDVVEEMLTDEYYSRRPPKSAGREQYGQEFVERLAARGLSPEDTVATATFFTAASVAEGIYRFAAEREEVDEVIVSGGGVHNSTLMRFLAAELADMEVVSSQEHGIDPDAKEAIAFAVLAHETWHGRPSNLPGATGARRPVVLGKLSR
jgi:anhydro-N-acetylmuramic acid kinase